MKISEVDLLQIKQGLRFKSIDGSVKGTVIAVDYLDDYSVYFMWDNEKEINNWFGNDCDCELLIEENTPLYDTTNIKREYLIRQEDFNKALLKFVSGKSKERNSKFYGLKLPAGEKEKINLILESMY